MKKKLTLPKPHTQTSASMREKQEDSLLPIDVDITRRNAEGIIFHPAINTSKGGMYLELKQPLVKKTPIRLRFPLPNSNHVITLDAEVVWTLEVEKEKLWGTGIRFVKVQPEDLEKIQTHAETILKVIRTRSKSFVPAEV